MPRGGAARFVRLLAGSLAIGVVMGAVGWAFLETLRWATETREEHGWLLYLLPVAGLGVGCLYHYLGGPAHGGTKLVARQVLRRTDGVPGRMAPLVFLGTAVGHLFGASVGREGAAVQMAGSLTDATARRVGCTDDERQVLLPVSVAAAFGAVLGTPVAGVVAALSLHRRARPVVVLGSAIAAVVGDRLVEAAGYEREQAPVLDAAGWSLRWIGALLVTGLVCGMAARLFDIGLHRLRDAVALLVAWPPLRPVIGGAITVVLAALVGRDYLGLSVPLIGDAFAAEASWSDAAWKLTFTVVALAFGFVGGEMVPLFVVGSTLGAAVASAFGLPAGVLVAAGFVTVFAAATSLTVFGVVAAVELFGWPALVPALVVGLVGRAVAGRPGLYLSKADLEAARSEL